MMYRWIWPGFLGREFLTAELEFEMRWWGQQEDDIEQNERTDCLSPAKGRSRSLMRPTGCLTGCSGALFGSLGPKA